MTTICIERLPVATKSLADKYRPRRLSQILGQSKAVAKVRTILRRRGRGGFGLWICGKPGQGKTTMARIVASLCAVPIFIDETDASQLTADDVYKIGQIWRNRGVDGGGRAWIFNEAHAMKPTVITALLTLLESGEIPSHCVMIFTTTLENMESFEGKYADTIPLLQRLSQIQLTSQGLAPLFARFTQKIASREGLGNRPIKDFLRKANEVGGSCRALLQIVDDGDMMV